LTELGRSVSLSLQRGWRASDGDARSGLLAPFTRYAVAFLYAVAMFVCYRKLSLGDTLARRGPGLKVRQFNLENRGL